MHLNPKRLRIVRMASIAALALAMLALWGTIGREVGLHFGGGAFVAVGDGCLKVGNNRDKLAPTAARTPIGHGPYVTPSWRSDWTVAWRPFRAADTFSRGAMGWHMLVVPVLPLVPLCALFAGWAHGRLSGLRDARTLSCVSCGYDLSRTPMVDGRRTCPECGAASAPMRPPAAGSAAHGLSNC